MKKRKKLPTKPLASGLVDIIISDGQLDATMKGGGDTRDNVPALLELVDMGVLPLSRAWLP